MPEVPRLHRLNVHHADNLVPRDDGDGEHRREALLVDLGHPFPARVGPNIARRQGDAGIGHPADDALAYPQGRPPDPTAVEAVRCHKAEHSVGALEEIQR